MNPPLVIPSSFFGEETGLTFSGLQQSSPTKSVDQFTLMFIDRGVVMVVAPVEPVIFQCRDASEAFFLRGTGNSAALKVPLAGGRRVDQGPLLGIGPGCGLEKKVSITAIDAAHEDTEGFTIGAEHEQ